METTYTKNQDGLLQETIPQPPVIINHDYQALVEERQNLTDEYNAQIARIDELILQAKKLNLDK